MSAPARLSEPFAPVPEHRAMTRRQDTPAEARIREEVRFDQEMRGLRPAWTPPANDTKAPPWSILRVTPNMERKVAAALGPKTEENPHGAGLQVYVPVEKYRPANHWRPRTRPLIPGYIFAFLPDDESLDAARGNHAVRDVMSKDGKPVKARAIDVGSLILAEACHAFDRTWRPAPARRGKGKKGGKRREPLSRWEHGQRVRVTSGPFENFSGQISEVRRKDRMGVLLMVFGRITEAEIEEAWLEAVT